MKHFPRRLAAAALALAMLAGTGAVAQAATVSPDNTGYTVKVEDSSVTFVNNGVSSKAYSAKNTDLKLITDEENDLLVCFYDTAGKYKGISLGQQSRLAVSGSLASLTLDKSLDSGVRVTVNSGASIKELKINSKNNVTVKGTVTTLTQTTGSTVTAADGSTITLAKLTSKSASLTGESGSNVKKAQVLSRNCVSGASKVVVDDDFNDDEKKGEYGYLGDDDDDDDEDKLRPRFETTDIYCSAGTELRDLRDDLEDSVRAYVREKDDGDWDERDISGRVTWVKSSRTEVDSSGSYRFKFTPRNTDKYRTAEGSITIHVQ